MKLGPVVIERRERDRPTSFVRNGRTIGEIVEGRLIVDVGDGYVITASERLPTEVEADTRPQMTELGSAGTRWRKVLGGHEYNPELQGLRGLDIYDRMRRSDSTVKQSLRIAKAPVVQGRWWVDSARPGQRLYDEMAEFVTHALFDWQTIGWTQFLLEALTCLDFGYSFFEKVYYPFEWKGKERIIWRKFAPRSPFDVVEWVYGADGGPEFVEMFDFEGHQNTRIPIKKMLVFSFDREAGNLEGISILRSAYKHWYYKENLYKIDAIQKERHGIGVPVIHLPPNFTEADKRAADELGRNLRANESAHIVAPPNWLIEFAELKGNNVDVMSSIKHHDDKIVDNVLASFIREQRTQGAEVSLDIFMKSSRFIADLVREVINKYAIPELINWNYADVTEYPKLNVRRIGEVVDLRTLTFALRNLVGAKVIIPDERLEDYVRDEADLTRRDPKTAREVETPQLPGGPPRQGAPSANQGQGTGEDRSGG